VTSRVLQDKGDASRAGCSHIDAETTTSDEEDAAAAECLERLITGNSLHDLFERGNTVRTWQPRPLVFVASLLLICWVVWTVCATYRSCLPLRLLTAFLLVRSLPFSAPQPLFGDENPLSQLGRAIRASDMQGGSQLGSGITADDPLVLD
jgi:hypothetical protein